MRQDFAFRGHDIAVKDDLEVFTTELAKRQIHSLAFAPSMTLPDVSQQGDNISFGLANHVRRTLAKQDVEIATLSCYVNLIHPDPTDRQNAIRKLQTYLQIAPAFGTHLVATETGSIDPAFSFTRGNFEEAPFKELLTTISQLLPVAHNAGTFLTLEPGVNHPLYSLDRVQQLLSYFNEDTAIKLIIDPANLVLSDQTMSTTILEEAFRRFDNRIAAVHIKDYVLTPNASHIIKTVLPGKGLADVQRLIDISERYQPFGIKCMDELSDGLLDQALNLPLLKQYP